MEGKNREYPTGDSRDGNKECSFLELKLKVDNITSQMETMFREFRHFKENVVPLIEELRNLALKIRKNLK